MSNQQTVLRVQTNNKTQVMVTGNTLVYAAVPVPTGVTYGGSGTQASPLTGSTSTASAGGGSILDNIEFRFSGDTATFYYTIDSTTAPTGVPYQNFFSSVAFDNKNAVGTYQDIGIRKLEGSFTVTNGEIIRLYAEYIGCTGVTFSVYVVPESVPLIKQPTTYQNLDLSGDIPIKISKSFAEIEDISKRNSDYSLGLILPGSKKNNKFFEDYFNVDTQSLFFNATLRVPCDVLIDDQRYFNGYMKLNKVSVMNSMVEYDVTLYSNVGDLFGKIGNNLLKDLDYNSIDYRFNHYFSIYNTVADWNYSILQSNSIAPPLYFYPIVHNGYDYVQVSGETQVNITGTPITNVTRLYDSTVVGSYANTGAFTAAGGVEGRINSPTKPLLDNQLKPALNIWGLIQLMFAEYGYTIKSDFFNTPWFKLLYLYGYYSSSTTKFGYTMGSIPSFGYDDVEIHLYDPSSDLKVDIIVVNKKTKAPCYCNYNIDWSIDKVSCAGVRSTVNGTIYANTSGSTIQLVSCPSPFQVNYVIPEPISPQVGTYSYYSPIPYAPIAPNTNVNYKDGDFINFNLVIDPNMKQIDLLSSIAKKFGLIFIPDPEVSNQIIIEPYDYYIGTGDIKDWTPMLSFDKGFTVEPALNFVESELIMTDLEDGDDGNKLFKDRNNRIYGRAKITNNTDFKSQTKTIETVFSPEVIRKWDERIGMPLGINYVSSNEAVTLNTTQKVGWQFKGVKSKPKLIFNMGNFSPFLDQIGESYNLSGNSINTMFVRVQNSEGVNPFGSAYGLPSVSNPIISHTMPIGNKDSNKSGRDFENDSISILFNSEEAANFGLGQPSYNVYTDNDIYNLFFSNRINNIYNPNTRYLTGNFYLKLSDIQNLKPNDLIKINEQYFTWNKIDGYNLTNTELTKVQLVQANIQPKTYPTRYFKYQYCGDSNVYRFKTYFDPRTNNNYDTSVNLNSIRRTFYYWSILYDYFVGTLGGSVSGYTSSYLGPSNSRYAYTISEIDKTEFDTITLEHTNDPNDDYFINYAVTQFSITYNPVNQNPNIWCFSNSVGHNGDYTFFNVASNCSTFSGYCATNYVTLSTPPTPI